MNECALWALTYLSQRNEAVAIGVGFDGLGATTSNKRMTRTRRGRHRHRHTRFSISQEIGRDIWRSMKGFDRCCRPSLPRRSPGTNVRAFLKQNDTRCNEKFVLEVKRLFAVTSLELHFAFPRACSVMCVTFTASKQLQSNNPFVTTKTPIISSRLFLHLTFCVFLRPRHHSCASFSITDPPRLAVLYSNLTIHPLV